MVLQNSATIANASMANVLFARVANYFPKPNLQIVCAQAPTKERQLSFFTFVSTVC
jgi:hypothetical protein